MSGVANYPTALDDNTSLHDVTDNVTAVTAAQHNNMKEAVKAIEAKIGVYNTQVPTSLDYRLGHPTDSHRHDGASGGGAIISPSSLESFEPARHIVVWQYPGSAPSGASLGAPLSIGRTMQLVSVQSQMRRAPSGATAAFDINFGATSVWQASQLLRPIFPPGVNTYQHASPNLVTYPSGALIIVDADKVGTNEPGSDISITFIFRD